LAKDDVKDCRLPVTAATPQLYLAPPAAAPFSERYLFTPIPTVQLPERYPVLDILGSFIMWVSEHDARRLLRARKVELLRRKKGKGKIIGLMAILDPDMPEDQIISRKKYFGQPHRRETEDNPPHVWAQDKMGSTTRGRANKHARFCRAACRAALELCLAEFRDPQSTTYRLDKAA